MKLRLTGAFVLVLSVVVFAGPAFAGNGNGNGSANGNGNGNGAAANAAASESLRGNSDSAPGQLKKEEEAAPAPADAGAVVADVEPANSEGVKPSNTTEHETHAAASSNKTKEYGNGRTAGQIAIANGAALSTILHGPGNSQPHKALGCSGRHEVDVHALKAKGHRKGCESSSPPVGPTNDPKPTPSNPNVSSDPKLESTPAADPNSPAAGPSEPEGEVASGSVEEGSHGVLSAAAVVAQGTLPFTGVQLWAVALFALMLVALGLVLRRQAAVPAKAKDR